MNIPLVFLLGVLFVSCAWAPPADWSLKTWLDKTGYSYQVDKDGDFLLTLSLGQGRSQKVWIRSRTNSYQGSAFREVFSLAQEYAEDPPVPLLKTLLSDSWENRLTGSWATFKQENGGTAVAFLAKIPLRTPVEVLGAVVLEVAESADRLEQLKSPEDRF